MTRATRRKDVGPGRQSARIGLMINRAFLTLAVPSSTSEEMAMVQSALLQASVFACEDREMSFGMSLIRWCLLAIAASQGFSMRLQYVRNVKREGSKCPLPKMR